MDTNPLVTVQLKLYPDAKLVFPASVWKNHSPEQIGELSEGKQMTIQSELKCDPTAFMKLEPFLKLIGESDRGKVSAPLPSHILEEVFLWKPNEFDGNRPDTELIQLLKQTFPYTINHDPSTTNMLKHATSAPIIETASIARHLKLERIYLLLLAYQTCFIKEILRGKWPYQSSSQSSSVQSSVQSSSVSSSFQSSVQSSFQSSVSSSIQSSSQSSVPSSQPTPMDLC